MKGSDRPGPFSERRSLLLAACILTGLLVACSFPGPRESVARQIYVLQGADDPGSPAVADTWRCLTIRIGSISAAPGFMTSRMAYQTETYRLDYFAYHEWADTPARMIASALAVRLDRNGMFGAVLAGSTSVAADFRLEAEVTRFLQDFRTGDSNVILEIKVDLVDVAQRSLAGSRTFRYSESASDANPRSGVAAGNRALQRFFAELDNFLAATLDTVHCAQ